MAAVRADGVRLNAPVISPKKSDKQQRLGWVLLLLMIGCGLRIIGLNKSSLWFDEVFSQRVAVQTSIVSIIYDGVAGDVHPPLYFVLLNAWAHIMGDSAFALRLLSAFMAILTLPAIFVLARQLFGQRAAWIALGLAAVSPLQIYYAQEARQYMLSVLCAAWIGVGLLRVTRGQRYGAPLYVMAAVAGLYTHYFTGLLLAALHLWLIGYPAARRAWRHWLLADLLIAVLFLPQIAIFFGQTQVVLGGFWIAAPNPAAPLTTLGFLLLGVALPLTLSYIAIVLIGCLLAIGYLDLKRTSSAYWLLCLLAVLGPLLLALTVSLVRSPIYLDRSFALLSPFLLSALAGGLARARRPSLAPLLAGLLLALLLVANGLHLVTPDPAKPPFRAAAEQIMAQPDALSVPIVHLHDSSYLPMIYYAPALDQLLINLDTSSWLFAKTWQIFGVQRWSRTQLADWLQSYNGTVRFVITPEVDGPALELFKQFMQTACAVSAVAYPDRANPQLVVYTVTHGACLTRDKNRPGILFLTAVKRD